MKVGKRDFYTKFKYFRNYVISFPPFLLLLFSTVLSTGRAQQNGRAIGRKQNNVTPFPQVPGKDRRVCEGPVLGNTNWYDEQE